jgi:hypothetical protein
MPQCRLPDGTVIFVSSCQECDKTYNGSCFGDTSEPGTVVFTLPCFVRNVLVRTLADALLDAGSCGAVTAEAIHYLSIGREHEVKPSGDSRQPLTSALRENLARNIAGGIMQLAATYYTTVEFRDRILLASRRGRELKAHYDQHLGEIYHVTALNLDLLHEAATVWLSVHPFVASMVRLTRGEREEKDPQDGAAYLSAEQYDRCKTLIRRFRDASKDHEFRRILEEIEGEFEGYSGLTAAESLDQLRSGSARS